MLTYSLEDRGDKPIYEFLYEKIRADILEGRLSYKTRLPSKRNFAKQLGVSVITVENAYAQLMAEGYIYSVPKSGFYVDEVGTAPADASDIGGSAGGFSFFENSANSVLGPRSESEAGIIKVSARSDDPDGISRELSQKESGGISLRSAGGLPGPEIAVTADFTNTTSDLKTFPFSVWSRLSRETLSEDQQKLLTRAPFEGVYELRRAICRHLKEFRSMDASPSQVIIGAGTEYLYSLLIQLLGRDKIFAAEDPGYKKVSRIYSANGVSVKYIPLDRQGMDIDELKSSGADIVHISPCHHFPTGIVTPIGRRIKLLEWAAEKPGRYIIEDDYDSEFRMTGRPLPTLSSIDAAGKVIYMNTFSKSLSQTIRISYMVLPPALLGEFKERLGFYSCTVSNLEQYTLAKFIDKGYFEKHINRMRNHYRDVRNALINAISVMGHKDDIVEGHSGLHFLLNVNTGLSDKELIERAAGRGVIISTLSQSYQDPLAAPQHTLVINYSGLDAGDAGEAVKALYGCIEQTL